MFMVTVVTALGMRSLMFIDDVIANYQSILFLSPLNPHLGHWGAAAYKVALRVHHSVDG